MTTKCKRCLYDETVPEIIFDPEGVCNYCHIHTMVHRAK